MGTSGKFRRTRQAFTLVELLTVILIISILMGMLTGAVVMARGMVKRTVVLNEIGQLDLAMERYKAEFGEYPPDFSQVDLDGNPAMTTPLEDAAQQQVLRHLKKRFPKYRPAGFAGFCADVAGAYGVNPATFDAASGLAFWLGGLPETVPASATDPWILRGFHTDPKFPFKQGSPRSGSFYEFEPERLVIKDPTDATKQFRYTPKYIEGAPLVYFKAIKDIKNGRHEYGQVTALPNSLDFRLLAFVDNRYGVAVPYLAKLPTQATPTSPWNRTWEGAEKYQIVSAGMDGKFGDRLPIDPITPTEAAYRVTEDGLNFSEDGGDFDNLTSVFEGKLEDAIQ